MSREVSIKVNARHIGQLGRELVTDYVTALTELVKNSYDADSEAVEVSFENMLSGQGKIIIADTGSGFTADDIEKKWAVIGTNSKVKEPYSKKYNRRCAGRKGIGRYSVERLAEHCTMYSFTEKEAPVKYYTNWNMYEGIDSNELKQRVEILKNSRDFESAKYIKRVVEYILLNSKIDQKSKEIIEQKILLGSELFFELFYDLSVLQRVERFLYPICNDYIELEEKVDEIKNVIEPLEGEEKECCYQILTSLYKKIQMETGNEEHIYTGTLLVLDCLRDNWKREDIEKVTKEFRLLVSPLEGEKDNFLVYVKAPEYNIYEVKLENNILKQRYAKVTAKLVTVEKSTSKKVSFLYATYVDKTGAEIKFEEEFNEKYLCGDLNISLYYFLRDTSLKFEGLNAREAKEILDAFCGVKIYRDGFRVRPYGEEGNDWLLLDRKKISDPHSYRVGNNQVIGVVNINSDENPLLIDSTNRESIIENTAFEQLKTVVKKCIEIIENHRYKEYLAEKKKEQISQEENQRTQEKMDLQNEINRTKDLLDHALEHGDISGVGKVVEKFIQTVSFDQRKEEQHYQKAKREYEKKLKDSNSELQLYKNLAALGILAGSFGHETDDAIARILLNIEYPKERMLEVFSDEDVLAAFNDLDEDIQRISCYSDLLVAFLKKKKRSVVRNISFKRIIEEIVGYYKILVNEYNISIDISDLQEFECGISMKQIDVESIIVNLLTNAFEALKGCSGKRIIKISTYATNDGYYMVFEDSGPGIPENKKEWIFIPLNTTKKEDGVGLGLTIVRDVMEKYGGTITVKNSADLGGAKFVINIPRLEVEDE